MNFRLFTRVTPVTWPRLQRMMHTRDLFWGTADGVPHANLALTFPDYAGFQARMAHGLDAYGALNLDGEYKDFALALSDAKALRTWVDAHNAGTTTPRLPWSAFYHLEIIDAYPEIVNYPDIVIVGKSEWAGDVIGTKAVPYLAKVRAAGRTPGILLGFKNARTGVAYTGAQIADSIGKVVGLGVSVVSFYYDGDAVDTLLEALAIVRPKAVA